MKKLTIIRLLSFPIVILVGILLLLVRFPLQLIQGTLVIIAALFHIIDECFMFFCKQFLDQRKKLLVEVESNDPQTEISAIINTKQKYRKSTIEGD